MKGVDKMKQFRSDNRKGGASAAKRLALALILIVACALMTACYMEPDRVVDAGNALDNSGKQDFQTVITDTPAPTNTPTPAPTSSSGQQMDWSAWTFGDDNATNPPASSTDASGVTATSTPSGGTITVSDDIECIKGPDHRHAAAFFGLRDGYAQAHDLFRRRFLHAEGRLLRFGGQDAAAAVEGSGLLQGLGGRQVRRWHGGSREGFPAGQQADGGRQGG